MPNTSDNNMIMKGAAYRHGVSLGDVNIENIQNYISQTDSFVWLGLSEPDYGLLATIQSAFALHELAVEDARSAHQRPKIEEYGDSLFIVLHTAMLKDDGIEFGETHFFVGNHFLVTVRHGASLSHSKVRNRCEALPHQLAKGPGFALYAVILKKSVELATARLSSMVFARLVLKNGGVI